MADTKLSALTELAATPAADDEVYIRDVSEAEAAESKRITIAHLTHDDYIHNKYRLPIWWSGLSEVVSGGTVTQDGAGVELASGYTNGNFAICLAALTALFSSSIFDKNPTFEVLVNLTEVTSSNFSFTSGYYRTTIGDGSYHIKSFGFEVINGALRAISCDGTTKSTTDLSTALSADTSYRIKQRLESGVLKTWVNGVAKANKTTNLPTGGFSASGAHLWYATSYRATATLTASILAGMYELDL